jgi:hydroxyacylglutathione hydrolase
MSIPKFNITAIPALQDNYIWAIHNGLHAVVIDPGEAEPVLSFLQTHELQLDAILCTHRHADHIGGIAKLREVYNVAVYGMWHPGNQLITHRLVEGSQLKLEVLGLNFDIIEVPGHVADHLAYLAPELLFCGDLLFGAGCGRSFEGTLQQLYHSLQRLALLPGSTRVYCAHEYTAANLRFALACEPTNRGIMQRDQLTRQLRANNLPTIPSTIALELATNPFLRCTEPELIHTLQRRGLQDIDEFSVFSALREWRDHF